MSAISQSVDIQINQIAIITKVGLIDIDGLFEELNIYDCIFNSVASGKILIRDSIGLSRKCVFDGTESLLINFSKSDNLAPLYRTFKIYKKTDIKQVNKTSETYVLHLISNEWIFSQQQIISKKYNQPYYLAAADVLFSYLNVDEENISFLSQSKGIREFTIPSLTPFESLHWLAKRSISVIDETPSFLFYENKYGFNYVDLPTLVEQEVQYNIKYQLKNVSLPEQDEEFDEFMSARSMYVVSRYDMQQNMTSGMYANRFIGYDVSSGKMVQFDYSFDKIFSDQGLFNKTLNISESRTVDGEKNTNAYDSSRTMYFCNGINDSQSKYIRKYDSNSINKVDDPYNYIAKRKAMIQGMMSQRINLVMAGNFDYTSGIMVYIDVPVSSEMPTDDSDNTDDVLSGNYIILAARHIITPQRHETVLEVGTNSTNMEEYYVETDEQAAADMGV